MKTDTKFFEFLPSDDLEYYKIGTDEPNGEQVDFFLLEESIPALIKLFESRIKRGSGFDQFDRFKEAFENNDVFYSCVTDYSTDFKPHDYCKKLLRRFRRDCRTLASMAEIPLDRIAVLTGFRPSTGYRMDNEVSKLEARGLDIYYEEPNSGDSYFTHFFEDPIYKKNSEYRSQRDYVLVGVTSFVYGIGPKI